MSRFEFNSVLVSIVIAFVFAEMIAIWSAVLREKERPPARFTILTIWLIPALIQHWAGLWSYRDVPFDRPLHSLAVIAPATTLAIAAHLLAAVPASGSRGDLDANFDRVRSRALPLCGLFVMLGVASDLCLPGAVADSPTLVLIVSGASLVCAGLLKGVGLQLGILSANAALAILGLLVARSS